MSEGKKTGLLDVLGLSDQPSIDIDEIEGLRKHADAIGSFKGPLGEQLLLFKDLSNIESWSKGFGAFVPLMPPPKIVEQAKFLYGCKEAFKWLGWSLGCSQSDAERVAKNLGDVSILKEVATGVLTAKVMHQFLASATSQLLKDCEQTCNQFVPICIEWNALFAIVKKNRPLIEFIEKTSKRPPDSSWNEPIEIWFEIGKQNAQGCFLEANKLLVKFTELDRVVILNKAKQEFDELCKQNGEDCQFLLDLFRGRSNQNWPEIFIKGKTLLKQMELCQYSEATLGLESLLKQVENLKALVEKHNSIALHDAEDAKKNFHDTVDPNRSFDFSRFKSPETFEAAFLEAVAAFKDASQKDLLKILMGLHSPARPLTDEYELIQQVIYGAMKLDDAFVQADKTVRDEYRKALAENSEFRAAAKGWKSVDKEQRKQWVLHVAKVQCTAYKVQMPEIEWVNCVATEGGYYDQVTEILTINVIFLDDLKQLMNVVLHECTHRYQHVLARLFMDGKITRETHKDIYDQAEIFACTFHLSAYVKPDDNHKAYKAQPCEAHAMAVGDEEGEALVTLLLK